MCQFDPANEGRRLDPCMATLIEELKRHGVETVSCCCGHGKYPMTIVIRGRNGFFFELLSGEFIERRRRFYRRDQDGVYFIPEAIEP